MKKMDLLYDIDGVLRDFVSSSHKTLKKHFPKKVPNQKPKVGWHIHKWYPKFNKNEIYNLLFDKYAKEVFYQNAESFQWAIDSINIIRKKVSNINRIFLRTHQDWKRMLWTLLFLEQNKINDKIDGCFYTNSEIEKNIISNSILIDDKKENIVAHGLDKSILITRNWNKDFNSEYLKRATNTKSLLEHIYEILQTQEN